ncbi:MAG: hypothetical protein AB7N76_23325 [Planctomycetota bacterium]
MHPTRRPLSWLALALLAGATALVARDQDPKEVVPKPPRWDEEAARAFQQAGVPVPRTEMTGETDAPLDLAWIRRAFGFATPLTPAEVAAVEGGDGGPSRNGGAGGALGGRRRVEGGAAPGDAPAGGADELSDGARERRPQRANGPRPEPRAPAAPSQQGRMADADKAEESSRGLEFSEEAEKKAKDDKGGGGGEAPRPVLTKLETQPRLAKVLFRNAQGKFESLIPRAMRVVTFIEGPRARTTIDLVFQNPHDRRLQGTFYYPLPDGASPAAFGMFPGTRRIDDPSQLGKAPLLPPLLALPRDADPERLDRTAPQSGAETLVPDWQPLQQARVVEQKRARQVYEEVVRQNVDPALMEWSGGNTFQARVFPIEARGLKRLVFSYERTLPLDGGLLRYVFPFPGAETLGEVESLVFLRDAGALVTGLPEDPQALRAPSGAPEPQGGWTRLRYLAPRGYQGALDLVLKPEHAGVQALRGPIAGLAGEALFARLLPQVPSSERRQATERALFCVDTSLSEDGVRRALSGQLLLRILERDPSIREYAVLLFDVRPRWLHRAGMVKNTPEQRAETAAELAKVYLEGATHFAGALDEVERAASWLDVQGKEGGGLNATRFLLSDGLITWGQDRVDELLRQHPKALAGPWFSYRFGDVAVNRALFDALSRESAGRAVNVLSAEQLDAAATAHRRAPVVLEEVRVAGAEARDLVVAGAPRLLFPGQELEIGARLVSATPEARLELVMRVDGQRKVQQVPLAAGASPLAARAWAELWTGKLLALDDERLDRMVVALSQAFGLANRAASLLILEGEADWQRYALDKEQVDLADLERQRAIEEDQRRDRLQGIALDDISREGRDLVRLLAAVGAKAFQPALPLLDRPLAGGAERISAEVAYRAARAKDLLDVGAYDAVARARALSGDTMGAVRALSSLVEQRPRDGEACRLVGYACLALGQYGPAAELFERVRLTRPFEPQSYLEEALALEALGRWSEAARRYEIALARAFPRHVEEVRTVAAYHYGRLLQELLREGNLPEATREAVGARAKAVLANVPRGGERTALQLSIHWNTDATDIDLWVKEPEGERCFYQHQQTRAGGRLYWDTTTGYGPELYRRPQAGAGEFDVLIHYYGNNSARWTVPTAVLFVRDLDVFGPEDAYTRRFMLKLLPKAQAVVRLSKER